LKHIFIINLANAAAFHSPVNSQVRCDHRWTAETTAWKLLQPITASQTGDVTVTSADTATLTGRDSRQRSKAYAQAYHAAGVIINSAPKYKRHCYLSAHENGNISNREM